MRSRLVIPMLILALALGLCWIRTGRDDVAPISASAKGAAATPAAVPLPQAPDPVPVLKSPGDNPDEQAEVADALNAPGGNIQADLKAMNEIFAAWLTTFRSEGNPVGENQEITAALSGKNRLGVAFVPTGHRAVSSDAELCDRWGTPFRFHALSGTRMEIRSAGPDRKFGTTDDAEWAPWAREF